MMPWKSPARRRPVALSLFTLLALTGLAGCLAPSGEEPGPEVVMPPLGLGLAVPEDVPFPGPFLEDPEDLQTLARFVEEEGARMLEECGNPEAIPRIQERAQSNHVHRFILVELVSACGKLLRESNADYAQAAMDAGNEEEVRDQLVAEAESAIAEYWDHLIVHPGPGNAVEAMILDELTSAYITLKNKISSVYRYWIPYEEGANAPNLQLRNVYLNALGARADAEALTMILQRYPWTMAPCTAPDWDRLVARVDAKFMTAEALGWEHHVEPREVESSGFWHGRLLLWEKPEYEFFKEHGFWWSVLASEVRAEMTIAYWENRTQAEALPTIEEAWYMLAMHRNESRNTWSEERFMSYVGFLRSDPQQPLERWNTHKYYGAIGFMATLAARWPYAELDCPGSPAPE